MRRLVAPELVDRVLSTLRPAIGMQDGRLAAEPAALGTTRFAGRPDLPSDVEWPVGPDGPLAFIGQVSLAEVTAFDAARLLPPDGMLWFFYNIRDYAWGNDPSDGAKFRVVFRAAAAAADLARREFPARIHDDHRLEQTLRVRPYTRWEVGDQDELERQRLGLGDVDRALMFEDKDGPRGKADPDVVALVDALEAVDDFFTQPFIPVGTHQMFGWPACYEDPSYRVSCAATILGASEWNDAVRDEARQWEPLLAIGDNRDLYRDTWADGGSVIFLVWRDDVAARRFDRCWCALLST